MAAVSYDSPSFRLLAMTISTTRASAPRVFMTAWAAWSGSRCVKGPRPIVIELSERSQPSDLQEQVLGRRRGPKVDDGFQRPKLQQLDLSEQPTIGSLERETARDFREQIPTSTSCPPLACNRIRWR